jgi:threonine/homoserine/homoserine lactone efflux protein
MAEPMLSMPLSSLAGLVLAAAVVMGSPGPSTMSITAAGAAFGLRRSLGYLAGLVMGTTTVLMAVALGLLALLLSLPWLAPGLIAASGIYILYLAFRIATAPPLSRQARPAAAPSLAGGFLLAIANPKAYAAIAAVFAGARLDPVPTILVLCLMIILIHLLWLLAGASLSRTLHDPRRGRIANILFAAILVATTGYALLR